MPPSSGILKSFVVSQPGLAFTASSAVLGFFAVTPTPPLLAVSLLVAIVRLSAWTFAPRQNGYIKGGIEALAIAGAAGLAHLAPGLDATSTPQSAFLVLATISLIASAFAVALVFAGTRFGRSGSSHWFKLTLFPALWASGWASMAQVTGVGQLVTWSPVAGVGPYVWMRQYFGQWGIDWVAAAWAVVVSEVLGDWLVGAAPEHDGDALVDTEPLLPDLPHPQYGSTANTSATKAPPASRSASHLVLTGVLLLLMLPAYMFSGSPLPRLPSDDVTTLNVACALPPSDNPSLNDYIKETSRLQSTAHVILWPESAVRFESPAERDAAFAKIQNGSGITNKKYIGVSFEEFVPATRPGESGHRYNGFALLPVEANATSVIEYYKRNLVPMTESFSLTPGTEPPAIFELELNRPKGVAGPKIRPVPITASICLDFASTSSFTPLASRPALILAPAKTWHPSVGLAMWAQAQARAAETGASVLWCDGGRGGLSGIAGPRGSEVVQVGRGSWSKPLGVPYPFDTRRTWYERGGQTMAFASVWAVVLVGYVVEGAGAAIGPGALVAAVQAVVQRVRRGRREEPTYGSP